MKRGVISAPQPEAVDAGADIFARGGNAVDAATAFVWLHSSQIWTYDNSFSIVSSPVN